MTESYKIARLIYQAFVAPRPEPQDVAEFADALEIFADARGREKFVEDLLRESRKTEAQQQACDGDACPVEYPEPEPVLEPDTPPEPEPDTHTHTHTQPGPLTAEQNRLRASPVTERAKSARSTRS